MIRGCMRDPQVKLKWGIIRVNLDSGMIQVVSGTWFSVDRGFIWWENTCESFRRLEVAPL